MQFCSHDQFRFQASLKTKEMKIQNTIMSEMFKSIFKAGMQRDKRLRHIEVYSSQADSSVWVHKSNLFT